MNHEIPLRISLEKPPPGVDYSLQKGNGNNYETVLKQKSKGQNLYFDFTIKVKSAKKIISTFAGPFVQGPAGNKFIYINIGASAGQIKSPWNRRLKIPLTGISEDTRSKLLADINYFLETKVAGTSKDGSPSCATPKPFDGWKIVKK